MLSCDQTVLLLVDVQGRLARIMHDQASLFNSLELLIKGIRILDIPILWMEQIPSKLGPTVEEIRPLMTGSDMTPIEKDCFSCCNEPVFMDQFTALNRKQVLITGIETHICVFQTTNDLLEKGCDVHVVSDCVSSRTLANKEIGLQRMQQSGAWITSVEMALFELLKHARGDHFKKIVSLIK
jgi:nicotinamidase-related amidase